MNKSPSNAVKTRSAKSKTTRTHKSKSRITKEKRAIASSSLTLELASTLKQNLQIRWLDSGKPVLEGLEQEEIDVSLSHDDQLCLCVAGQGSQGCDIAPVTHRLREDWMALLSLAREPLLQKLLTTGSDSVDRAGTRVWAALEALRKATNIQQVELAIARQDGDSVLFKGIAADRELYILTFPVTFTRGRERIVATIVTESQTNPNHLELTTDTVPFPTKYPNETIYRLNMTGEKEKVFVVRWPVSYKETANLSQSVYFSNFFTWMGKVRDLAIWPIREPLGEKLATGEWGMVTNHAQTQIIREAGLNDVIEVRFWVAKVSGPTNSTVDFHYDWLKVLPDGTLEQIALSQLRMTWVHIPKEGTPEPKPLPDFLADCIRGFQVTSSPTQTFSETARGKELYKVPHNQIRGVVLKEQRFETTLEDTDAIGNINFAHYAILQGRVRDSFLHQLIPEFYRRTDNSGEFRCLNSKVEYLREAMPFEPIQVNPSLRAVYENSIHWEFEYFRLSTDGKQQKLAISQQESVWFARGKDGKFTPAPIPTAVRNTLIKAIEVASL